MKTGRGELELKKITVVGSISTDFIVSVKRRPKIGETVYGDDFQTGFGGKGANQAIALAKLGANVHMVGAVGDDSFSKLLIDNLKENHIETSYVKKIENKNSGSAVVTRSEEDNSIIYVGGANDDVSPEQILEAYEIISESELVLVQNETPQASVEALIDLCHTNHIPILVNPAPARPFPLELLEKITYFTPNQTEFEQIFPGQKMDDVLKQYPNQVIVTLSDKGARFFDGEEIIQVPPLNVSKITDTTGAGDTFNGALAYAIVEELTLKESIRFANVAGALSIQYSGAQGGEVSYQQVLSHLKLNQ